MIRSRKWLETMFNRQRLKIEQQQQQQQQQQ